MRDRQSRLLLAQLSKNERRFTSNEFKVEVEDKLGRKAKSRRSSGGPHRALVSFKDDEEAPLLRSTGRKANPGRSPGGPHIKWISADDEEESLRRSKMKTAGRKLSSTPPYFEETENQSTHEGKSPPPKKSPKVDDLMYESRSISPIYCQPYVPPLLPPLPPPYMPPPNGYGYGGVVPGTPNASVTGVGDVSNSIISNVQVDNDNSVRTLKFYGK